MSHSCITSRLSRSFFSFSLSHAGREVAAERKSPLWRDAKTVGRSKHLRRRISESAALRAKARRLNARRRKGRGRRGMTGQVRLVTSWMISAGPDASARARARASGANADAYVSAGATRIRAVGACPSRLPPPAPLPHSILRCPPFALYPAPHKHLYLSLARRYKPALLSRSRSPDRGVFARGRRRKRCYLYSCAPWLPERRCQDRRRERKKKRRERRTAFTSPRCMHTKLCRGEF